MRTTVRRTVTTLSLMLSVLVLSALPALAAEEASKDSEINGVLLSLIIGSIVGALLFLDAYRGDTGHSEHHSDHAGH